MAEVTGTTLVTAGLNEDRDGARAGDGAVDPRAVRVRLAAASRQGEEPALRIGPAGEPLRMTNPTVGRGPLGGVADTPDVTIGVGTTSTSVSAQRQSVLVDGLPADVTLRGIGSGRHVVTQDGNRTRVILETPALGEDGVQRREVLVDGFRFEVETESERIASLRERATRGRAASAHTGPLEVRAIIPGKVVAISVAAGEDVIAGQQLLVVEAMKMQNELRAPRDGTITRVSVAPGVKIEVGDLLVVIG
jgi:biotin carboxyl carrier protein